MINSRKMRWAGHIAKIGAKRNACRRKPEGKRLLGRSRRTRIDNIKMDYRVIGWHGTDWIWLRIGASGGLL
jgi:hypothetical protein